MTKQKDSFSGLDLRSENGVHISPDSNLGDIDDKNLSEQIRERYSQDTQFRKHLARWVMWIIPIWLFIVIAILVFCGIGLFSLGPADYSPKFDESYLNSLIEKAYPRLKDVDPVQWLDELRRED